MHTYTTNNSAGATMVFPTNTWGSSYSVQSYGGLCNSGKASSFFFVMAKEDNTQIEFTPTNDIVDSSSATIFKEGHLAANVLYKKGLSYLITLDKGEVFNAMAFVQGSGNNTANGLDLSGSSIKSVDCTKKIAVFGGSGRVLVTTSSGLVDKGSDNLIQQMFPKVAWGTKYLTVPTRTMEFNVFRIYVSDVTTKVWVNNPSHTTPLSNALFNAQGQYYAIEGNKPNLIESDKPISVTQFIIAYTAPDGNDKTHPLIGNGGKGDPEMIILSPVQQTINQATVYSSNFKNSKSGASYLNVIIKKSGIRNFKLDGGFLADTGKYSSYSNIGTPAIYDAGIVDSLFKFFKIHPIDTNYYYAQLRVSSGQNHTVEAPTDFSSIAYGVNDGESYGYNAGTAINNLSAIKFSLNPYGVDTTTTSVKTCKNNLVTLQIALPYDTSTVNSITWDAGTDASRYIPTGVKIGAINPATTKPAVVGTIVKDGRTFYIYKSPVQYQFFEAGAYKVKVTINGTFSSDCGGTEIQNMNVIVGYDDILFKAIPTGCRSTKVLISDASTPLSGTTITKWLWDFGDGIKDSAKLGDSWTPNPSPINTPHTYPNNNSYYVKLTTFNSVGCFSIDSVLVDLAFNITSTFTQSKDTACVGNAIIFTPTSSSNATKWFWDFGDDSPIDSSNTAPNPIAHSYTLEGSHTITHWVKTSAGCPSNFVKDTIYIAHKPTSNFILPSGVCVPGFTLFTNNSDTSNPYANLPYSYQWDFGVLALNNDTSNIKNPSYKYTKAPSAGEYAVSLTTTSRFGCVSNVTTKNLTTVYDKPVAIISPTSSSKVCEGNMASFSDVSTAKNQAINGWFWNFGDGSATINQKNPPHTYTKNNLDTVTLFITTQEGCKSDTVQWFIKVNPKPVAATKLPNACAGSGVLLFEDKSTIAADDSTQTPFTYTWNFGDGGTAITKDSTHNYAGLGTYYITHTVTSLNGCTDTKKDTFTIDGVKPIPKHKIPNNFQICLNETINLLDSSTVTVGAISKVIINWDFYNRFGLSLPNEIDKTPQNGIVPITTKNYPHKYPVDTTGKNGIIVKVYNYSSDNCYSEDSITVNTYGVPNVVFDTIRGLCTGNGVRYIKTARDYSGKFDNPLRVLPPVYSGIGVVNDSFYAAIAGVGKHLIQVIYETRIPFANHCKDTAYAPITVWDLPTVKFGTSPIKCEKNNVQFLDSSLAYNGSGNITKWLWDFGEPSSGILNEDTLKNPLHSYSTVNTFNVTLKVTSDSGCSNTIAVPKPINIYPKPVVGFIPPKGVCVGAAAVFTDTSKISDGTSPFTYKWNFGDPSSATNIIVGTGSPFNSPAHIYSSGLTDTIRLVVTSTNGCSDSAKRAVDKSLTFQPTILVYKINGNTITDTNKVTRVCIGNVLNFESAFKANAYSWYLGDTSGVFYNSKNLPHTYPLAQIYKGSFYVIDSNGCNTVSVPINIEIWAAPTPKIKIDAPFCEGSKIKFTDLSTTPANTGNIKTRTWDFGIVAATDTGRIASYTYANAGNYNVTITIKSDSGCVATLNPAQTITINPKPVVGFIAPKGVCKDSASIFTDTSKISDGSILNYAWNFGDPTSATNLLTGTGLPFKNPSHNYSSGITDTIRLLVTSTTNGCSDSVKRVVDNSITFPLITPIYKIDGAIIDTNKTVKTCLGNSLNFSPAFKANAYTWQFGDTTGINYNTASLAHTYPLAQTFKGSFKMIDSNGCNTKPVPINIEIWGLPTPAIKVGNPTCFKNSIAFTNLSTTAVSTGNIKTSLWSFGDASAKDTSRNPTHTYADTGKYYITLKVTSDSGGCATTKLVDSVIVHPLPNVKFGMPTSLCLPNAVAKFTDSTTIADGSGDFKYNWDFGDANSINNTSNLQNPTHIYDSSKDYYIKLIVTSKDGCEGSSQPKLLSASVLHPKPVAHFTAKSNGIALDKLNPKICFGKTIQFKDSSGSNVDKSYWIWGDDGTTTYLGLSASYYNFVQPGTYQGLHYILDKNGCESYKTPFSVDVNTYATVTSGEQFIYEGKTEFLNPIIEDANAVVWTAIYPNAKAINYLDDDSSLNPLCTPLTDSIIYKILATTAAECSDSAYYTVKRFYAPKIPNAFSPNGDGINDEWNLTSLNNFVGASVQVFNRYGQIVFNRLNPSIWNGKDVNGQPLPVGTYYYIIKPGYGLQIMSGSITILR